jgi:hypothetical protein
VGEHLHERVLYRFVGIVDVAQVLVGDADGAALLPGDQLAKALARGVALAGKDQRLDGTRDFGLLGQDGRTPPLGSAVSARRGVLVIATAITILRKGFRRRQRWNLRVDLLPTRPVRSGASPEETHEI